MSLTKRVSGDYLIKTVDSSSNVTIQTNTLIVRGNLDIIGSASKLESIETVIYDNIITLNGNVTGTPTLNAGIEINRGDEPTVSLRWNEGGTSWEVTSDGTNYFNVLDAGTQGVFLRDVYDDKNPELGGNLSVGGFSVYSNSSAVITIDSNLSLKYTSTAPNTVAGYNVIYANTPAGGGSGLFITNESTQRQELITKTKAIVYSIIM